MGKNSTKPNHVLKCIVRTALLKCDICEDVFAVAFSVE